MTRSFVAFIKAPSKENPGRWALADHGTRDGKTTLCGLKVSGALPSSAFPENADPRYVCPDCRRKEEGPPRHELEDLLWEWVEETEESAIHHSRPRAKELLEKTRALLGHVGEEEKE